MHPVTSHPGAGTAALTAAPHTIAKPRYSEAAFQAKLSKTLKNFDISKSKFDLVKEYIALQFMRDGAAADGISKEDGQKYFDYQYGPDRQRQLFHFIKDSGGRLPSEIYADDTITHAFVTQSFMDQWDAIAQLDPSTTTDLNISNISDLYRLPRNIKCLNALTRLQANHNALELLPSSIGRLPQLTTLELNHNALKSMPYRFSHLAQLKEFSAHHNQFTTLPYYLRRFAALEKLDLSHNRIGSIKGRDFLFDTTSSLIELNLSHNDIWTLNSMTHVHTLTNLQILNCSHNEIISISKNFGKLRALKRLDLSYNKLDDMPDLYIPLNPGILVIHDQNPDSCVII